MLARHGTPRPRPYTTPDQLVRHTPRHTSSDSPLTSPPQQLRSGLGTAESPQSRLQPPGLRGSGLCPSGVDRPFCITTGHDMPRTCTTTSFCLSTRHTRDLQHHLLSRCLPIQRVPSVIPPQHNATNPPVQPHRIALLPNQQDSLTSPQTRHHPSGRSASPRMCPHSTRQPYIMQCLPRHWQPHIMLPRTGTHQTGPKHSAKPNRPSPVHCLKSPKLLNRWL